MPFYEWLACEASLNAGSDMEAFKSWVRLLTSECHLFADTCRPSSSEPTVCCVVSPVFVGDFTSHHLPGVAIQVTDIRHHDLQLTQLQAVRGHIRGLPDRQFIILWSWRQISGKITHTAVDVPFDKPSWFNTETWDELFGFFETDRLDTFVIGNSTNFVDEEMIRYHIRSLKSLAAKYLDC